MKETNKFLEKVYTLREYPLILTFEKVNLSEEFIEKYNFITFPEVKDGSETLYLSKVIHNKEDLYALSQSLTKELESLFKPLEGLSHEGIERQLYEIALVSTVITNLIRRLMLYTY